MSVFELNDQVRDLNVTYLLTCQLMISQDRASAMVRLNLSEQDVALIQGLSAKQIMTLAGCGQLLMVPRFDSAKQISAALNNDRDGGLVGTHVALLLATQAGSVAEAA